MKNNNDSIRQENKKAIPKFILVLVLSLVVGFALGLSTAFLNFESFEAALESFGLFYASHLSGWLLCACPVVEFALGLPLYFNAKRQFAFWDGEDENVSNFIENKLSICIVITGAATVLGFFLIPGHFAGMVQDLTRPVHDLLGLGAFLVVLIGGTIFQQKLVDATKRLNPEKHGSVYDTKFQKTWLDSCDEAEKAIIGQCALKAYQAVTYTCLALWAVFTLGGLQFDWGFLPATAVCTVWAVNQLVYSYWAVKLPQRSSSSAL